VKSVRVQVILAQHVVQHDAGAGHDVARSLAVGVGHARGIALGVAHTEMGGAAPEGRPGSQVFGPAFLDLAHDLEERDTVLAGSRLFGRPAAALEELERQSEQAAAKGGGGVGEQKMAAIAGQEGRPLVHPVCRQVGLAEEALAFGHLRRHATGQGALVELPCAVLGQGLEEGGQVRVREGVSLGEQGSLGCEEGSGGRREGHDGLEERKEVGLVVVEGNALARQLDGRGQHLGEGEAAEALVNLEQAQQGARNRRRAEPRVEDLIAARKVNGDGHEVGLQRMGRVGAGRVRGGATAKCISKSAAAGRICKGAAAGCVCKEIEDAGVSRGGAGQQEAASAQAGESGLADRGGEARPHRGVEGVAPGAQGVDRGLAHARVSRGHDAVAAPPRCSSLCHRHTVATRSGLLLRRVRMGERAGRGAVVTRSRRRAVAEGKREGRGKR